MKEEEKEEEEEEEEDEEMKWIWRTESLWRIFFLSFLFGEPARGPVRTLISKSPFLSSRLRLSMFDDEVVGSRVGEEFVMADGRLDLYG